MSMRNVARVKRGGAIAACAVGVVVGVVPDTANALSCAGNLPNAPWPDQADVPTDARLWGYPGDRTRLLGPSNEVVPLDERAFRFADIGASRSLASILVPRERLQPNARYTVEVDGGGEYDPWRVCFVTGGGPGGPAPAPPTLLSTEPTMGAYFEGGPVSRWLTLEFEGIRERGLILIGDTNDVDQGALDELPAIEDFFVSDTTLRLETLLDGPTLDWASTNESLSVGRSDCLVWPSGAGDALDARFGVFDLAGNFSGWVELPLELPSAAEAQAVVDARREAAANENVLQGRPSACAMTPASTEGPRALGAWSVALGVAGLALRRSRRARRNARRRG